MKQLAILIINLYRLTGAFRRPSCRFYPSCSLYGRQALEKHGFLPGLLLTASRILRCHPWHPGGLDEVPARLEWGYAHKRKGRVLP